MPRGRGLQETFDRDTAWGADVAGASPNLLLARCQDIQLLPGKTVEPIQTFFTIGVARFPVTFKG